MQRKHYREQAPYLKTALFDIERSPKEQEIPLGVYDMVIGTNVVHATRNIAQSLQNIKGVLKKDGILLLNELSQNKLFHTLTFGLLEGWWLYEDGAIRMKGSPGLSPGSWRQLLKETGFWAVETYPENKELPQQIISARSNGVLLLPAMSPDAGLKKAKKPLQYMQKKTPIALRF